MAKEFEPSLKKGLMFLRHELEDLKNNLARQDNIDEGFVLLKEHQFNMHKLEYWIDRLKVLERGALK